MDPAFADLARAFTATAYAERPAGDENWRSARAAYDALARAEGTPA